MFNKKKSATPEGRRTKAPGASKNEAVFSYYQNRDTEFDASKSREKPSFFGAVKARLRHTPTIIAGVVILASVLFALSLSDKPRISVVNEQNVASEAFLRPQSEYQAAAQKLLQQSVLTRNKLTLDTGAIEQALQEQFSELTNVAVVLPLVSRTPVVYVQVAEPVLLLESGPNKFVIDEKGRALIDAAQAGDLAPLGLIPVKDAAQLAIQPGSQVLTGNDVRFMQTVRDQLAAKGMKVSRMELPARAGEVNVYIEGKPYYVKFTTTGDALQQVGTYLTLDQHLTTGKKPAPKEYVDVRVPERAYYK
jgi:hypothetical protein